MAKVTVIVDQGKCDGCEECVFSCLGEVLEMIDGQVVVVRVEDCQVCGVCEEICPKKAITVSEV